MGNVEITSGKIKNDACHYTYGEKTENGSQEVDVKPQALIHDDMRRAFRQLVPHLAYICELVPKNKQLDIAMDDIQRLSDGSPLFGDLVNYKVTAFKVSGTGDAQGVTITGQKKLDSGKILNLNTPFLKWEDEYAYIQELRIAIGSCQSEILQYMEGKFAPDLPGLFDDLEDDVYKGEPEDFTEGDDI